MLSLAIALGNAALITYVSALPFIVEDTRHESPQLFSLFFMINSTGRGGRGGPGRPGHLPVAQS